MAFRRVRRHSSENRKALHVVPIIQHLLEAIEGNGMTVHDWFQLLDQLSTEHLITQTELAKGMRMLERHGPATNKHPVFTSEKVLYVAVGLYHNFQGTVILYLKAFWAKEWT